MKPMLAKTYHNQNIDGWLMSEKLDGVRAIWTGSKLMSRLGNQFFAPESFTSKLPQDIMLDGELYMGRGRFQETVGIVKRHIPLDHNWLNIQYCVFDAPEVSGRFDARIKFCRLLDSNDVLRVVKHILCKDRSHLIEFYNKLCDDGAEGIMLKNPVCYYEQKRSANLLKYKPMMTSEAVVIGYEPGKGKYVGMVGALLCDWCEKVIKLGSGLTDAQRTIPPDVGTTVTFKFQCLTDAGLPRFPVFITERID